MDSDSDQIGSRVLILLCFLAGLIACNKVKPRPPAATGFDDSLTVASSYITAPVLFEIADLEDKINEELGPVLVDYSKLPESQRPKNRAWNLRVERAGRIRIAYDGKRLTFGAPLKVWIEGPIRRHRKKDTTSQQEFCSLDVNFNSPLQVQNDWRVQTKVKFAGYRWIKKPAFRVLGIKIPLTKVANNILTKRKEMIETSIDKAVHQELRLDREVERIWRDLQKPLLVSKKIENVWLRPRPFGVLVGQISGNSKRLIIPIRLQLRIDTEFGPRPVYAISGTLPKLRIVDSLPYECSLNALSRIPYSAINSILTRHMKGQKIGPEGHHIEIKHASVYGGQHALIVRADVKGSVNGTLYLRGQPAFDTVRGILSVRRVDFDVHTEEMLFKTADWLLHDTLKSTLQSTLALPLERHLTRLPLKIEQAFARGKTGRKASIDIQKFKLVPYGIAVRPQALEVLVHADAKLALNVKDL